MHFVHLKTSGFLRVLRTRDRIVRSNTWFIQSLLERINESSSHGVVHAACPEFFLRYTCADLKTSLFKPYLATQAELVPKFLTALPVYNEVSHVSAVLDEVLHFTPHVLVVDDGSTDGTADLLAKRRDIRLVRHETNRGYGAALATAFATTLAGDWDGLVTIDCDGQHQPRLIPALIAAAIPDPHRVQSTATIVSGSRYLKHFEGDNQPPESRRRINAEITAEINARLSLRLTDAFCGFKAYTRSAIEWLHINETGYAMPLEVWVQAAAAGVHILELPVPLVYLDLARSFGGALDDAATRLAYYRCVLDRAEMAVGAAAHAAAR
ncbi:MAG: glycosyltransferase family 2 protein [Planctomycetia bacterium]|nr:glycosyltransferase family 2 protein [Planctomycetia bacterium]